MECLLVFRWRASSLSRSTDWRRKCIDSICHVTKHDMHGNQFAPRRFWITKWTNKGPKCNCAAAQQLDLLSPSSSSSTEASSRGGPFPALSRALTGKQRGAILSLFSLVLFLIAGQCRYRLWASQGEGTLTLVVVGCRQRGVSWCYGLGRSQREPVYAPGVTWRRGREREEYRAKSTNMSKCCLHYR